MTASPTSQNSGRALSESLATIAVASSIVAIGLGGIYWFSRIGFANPLAPVVKCAGLALLFINAPYVIWLGTRRGEERWFRSYPFVWLVASALIAAIGRIQIEIAYALSLVVTALGLLSFLTVLMIWTRSASFRRALLLILGSGFFATWAGGVVWGRIYKSPLFFETMITTGIVHHDGVTLAALGNMLRTYHAASMGLDGVTPYMAYHWGTPWLFAQLSNLTDISVLEFYQLGYPVVFVPLFFGGILSFGAILRGVNDHLVPATRDKLYWVVFIAATMGMMPLAGMDALGVWTSNLTISESYAVAMPVALMLLAAAMIFWKTKGDAIRQNRITIGDYIFIALILPAGLVALGYLKISLMILGSGALMYAALRLKLWRQPPVAFIALVVTAVIYLTYKRTSLVAHHEGIVPLDFLKGFVPPVWWQFFVLFQLFWTLVYIVLRLRREGARTVSDSVELLKQRKILDVEVLAVIAVAGILPGLIMHIDGGSAFYFSDIQRWVAVGLLLGSLPRLLRLPSIRWSDLRVIALAFVAAPLVVSTLRNSVHWTFEMLKANAELRAELYTRAGVRTEGALRALPHLKDPRILAQGLFEFPSYNAVIGLMRLGQLPVAEKRQTLVFVPQSDSVYWHILKRPNSCGFSGFVVPSLTGMAMVDGMPAAECKLSPYYGLSLFAPRTRAQTAEDTKPEVICARAKRLGFSKVLTLRFDESGNITSEPTRCTT